MSATAPSDLIEEVAKAIWKAWAENVAPDGSEVLYQKYTLNEVRQIEDKAAKEIVDLCLAEARAAAAVIIEACAKVAENTTSEFEEGYRMAAIFAATNIRALAPAKPEGA